MSLKFHFLSDIRFPQYISTQKLFQYYPNCLVQCDFFLNSSHQSPPFHILLETKGFGSIEDPLVFSGLCDLPETIL